MILIYVFGWCYWYLLDYWLSYFSPIYVVVATHLLMHLYLKTLTSIIRTDQPTLVELTDFAVLSYNFSVSSNFPQNVNLSAQISGCGSHSLSILDLFLFSVALVFVM